MRLIEVSRLLGRLLTLKVVPSVPNLHKEIGQIVYLRKLLLERVDLRTRRRHLISNFSRSLQSLLGREADMIGKLYRHDLLSEVLELAGHVPSFSESIKGQQRIDRIRSLLQSNLQTDSVCPKLILDFPSRNNTLA